MSAEELVAIKLAEAKHQHVLRMISIAEQALDDAESSGRVKVKSARDLLTIAEAMNPILGIGKSEKDDNTLMAQGVNTNINISVSPGNDFVEIESIDV